MIDPSETNRAPPARASLIEIFKKSKKPENFWFTVYYGLSTPIVFVAVRAGWRPNTITIAGFLLNLLAACIFIAAPSPSLAVIWAFAVFTIAHVFDCADGHLAFVANMRSETGAWLDASLDGIKLTLVSFCVSFSLYSLLGDVIDPRLLAICVLASLGSLANYTVSMTAHRYKNHIDQYVSPQLSDKITGTSLNDKFLKVVISHFREYGNFLFLFLILSKFPVLGACLMGAYGAGNFALALNRILWTRSAIARSQKNLGE
jgi:phosphatidylglycerophosphate synthase